MSIFIAVRLPSSLRIPEFWTIARREPGRVPAGTEYLDSATVQSGQPRRHLVRHNSAPSPTDGRARSAAVWATSADRITAPPASEKAPGRSPTTSQTHTGPSTLSSTAMSDASATGMSRAPRVKSRSPVPSWPMPNSARSARSRGEAVEGAAGPKANAAASPAASAAAAGMGTERCHRTTTVAAANAVAIMSASPSPLRDPGPGDPHSITIVPARATAIATKVRHRTRSPRHSQPPRPAMKGERLWMISVFATEVRARAMMKHVDAVAKQAAMRSPGQPISRTSWAMRARCAMATADPRKPAQNTERQNTVVHGSVLTRRAIRPPLLQQIAAAATSQNPRRRVRAEAGAVIRSLGGLTPHGASRGRAGGRRSGARMGGEHRRSLTHIIHSFMANSVPMAKMGTEYSGSEALLQTHEIYRRLRWKDREVVLGVGGQEERI